MRKMKNGRKLSMVTRMLYMNGPMPTRDIRIRMRDLNIRSNTNDFYMFLKEYFKDMGVPLGSHPVEDRVWGIKDYSVVNSWMGFRRQFLRWGKVSWSRKTVHCSKDGGRRSFEYCIHQCKECEGAYK